MSFLRRKMHLTHKAVDDGQICFDLPPGEYFIGDSTSVIEEQYNNQWLSSCEGGLFTIKSPTPQFYVISTMDTDGAYYGSNGRLYQGPAGIYSASLIRKDVKAYDLETHGEKRTFTEPVTVQLFGYGDNFGLHGIQITSGPFLLRIATDYEGMCEDESGQKVMKVRQFDYENGWFKEDEEEEDN